MSINVEKQSENMEINKSILENYSNNFFNDTKKDSLKVNLTHLQINKMIHDCTQMNPKGKPLLNMLSWNVRCLTHNKLNIMKHYLDEWTRTATTGNEDLINCLGENKNYFIDIIGLTETWLTENTKFSTFSIRNYNSVHANRKMGKKGGGLLLFVHKKYQSIIIETDVNDDIEYVLLKLFTANNEFHVLLVYRPNGSFDAFVDKLEELILKTNRDSLIITGDMNLNVLNECDNRVKTYLDTLTSLSLVIINSAPTRNSFFGAEGTLIDHAIVSSSHKNILALTSNRTQLISDHNFLLILLQLDEISPKKRTIIRKKTLNYDMIASKLQHNLSTQEINTDDVNSYFNVVHDKLLKTIEECTCVNHFKLPSKINSLPAWADVRYKEMLRTLHNLEEKIDKRKNMSLPRSNLVLKYNELTHIFEQYGNVKAKSYYRRLQLKNTSHAWKIINELTGRIKRNKVMIVKDEENKYISDPVKIANTFQKKFMSVSKSRCSSIDLHKYIGKLTANTFCFEEISQDTISHHIALLNENKSCGYDGINAKVLKCCVEELSPHLSKIFNLVITTGAYPDRLKQSTIIPIHKGGDPLECGNYRPISLLPLLDKVFEAILYNQLNKFLENQNIFDPLQYGFRQRRGCNEAIAMMLNLISNILEGGKNALVISLDISKAFDSVDHRILLRKLNFLGIRGLSYDVLCSFLSNRKQSVKIDQSFSLSETVEIGVPQGSNLGPLLFNLMINDISALSMNSKLIKYADDIIMILTIEKDSPQLNINNLQSDIDTIMQYYEINLLKVNLIKSKYMMMGRNEHEELSNLLNKNLIIKCDELTYLGCLIDAELKFISQVDKIAKSIGSAVNALRYLKSVLSQDALIQFFHAHIQSHINFPGFVLMHCRAIDIQRLQRLQNKALKIIFNLPDLHSTAELFKKEAKNILPVAGLIYNTSIIMVRKCVTTNDGSLPKISRLRSLRKKELMLTTAKKRALIDDITHSGCKLYNQLPTEIKAENNFFLFKKDVKQFLLSRNESLVKSGQFSSKNFFI